MADTPTKWRLQDAQAPMNATNQEACPEDLDVLDHGSIAPTLLDSLVEDLECSRIR